VPRRHKGPEYLPEIPVLLRDAQELTVTELAEPDARKRRERERDRDLAIDHLTKMCRDAEKHREMGRLNPLVRMFCEELKKRNHGQLPKAKGGRPANQNRRLFIAVSVREAIEELGGKRGSVDRALRVVADRERKAAKARGARILRDDCYQYVKEIHYDYDRDPELRRLVTVEMACRKLPCTADVEAAWKKFLSEG
jgi:hypothetical protein